MTVESFADGAGLVGISGVHHAAGLVHVGLQGLQHRGDRGVGIASAEGGLLRMLRRPGLAGQAIERPALQELSGTAAVGCVWGRAGDEGPVLGQCSSGRVAAMLAGRFTNGARLRQRLQEHGALLQSSSDAEVLLHLIAQSGQRTVVNRLVDALWSVEGAYAVVVLAEDRIVAVRDPSGFRPLVLGRLRDGLVVASEDHAIRALGGTPIRSLAPGEMIILEGAAEMPVRPFPPAPEHACVHELVSLARADATQFGRATFVVRTALGRRLATEQPCPLADVVTAVPGAEPQALGFAERAGLPSVPGLLPEPHASAALAPLQAVPAAVVDRRVCLVAASVARGPEVGRAVAVLRGSGAREVHLRVAAPWLRRGCWYGVTGPTDDELFEASSADPAARLAVDTIGALSLDGMRAVVAAGGEALGLCDACFSGEFPIAPRDPADDQLPLPLAQGAG